MSFLLAPYVVAERLPRLWLESIGLGGGRSESARMVEEKWTALQQGLAAGQAEMVKASFEIASAVLAGSSGVLEAARAPQRITQAALAPAESRVRANAKRLGGF